MSATGLIVGKLINEPQRREGQGGKSFALCTLATTTEDGDCTVSVIAFGSLADQVLAMTKGDTAAMVGRIKPRVWTGRDGEQRMGLSLTCDGLLTAYHLRQKRKAMRPEQEAPDE